MATTSLMWTGWSRVPVSGFVRVFAVWLAMLLNSHALPFPQFSPASNAPTTVSVTRLTTGDLNRDGHADIVALNQGTNLITVLLGVGGGTFNSPMTYQTLKQFSRIEIGDFNNDQKLDIALAGAGLGLALGDGQGAFSTNMLVHTNTISSLTVADFNTDGNLDLAWPEYIQRIPASQSSYGVRVASGNGDGTFRAPLSFSDVGLGQSFLVLAGGDLNGDGHPDLVSASSDRTVVLTNDNGTGRFPVGAIYSHSGSARVLDLIVADFNDDDRLDVAWLRGYAHLRLNKGGGVLGNLTQVDLGAFTAYDGQSLARLTLTAMEGWTCRWRHPFRLHASSGAGRRYVFSAPPVRQRRLPLDKPGECP